jgi:cobalamin biosynthesis Co2+ chelatase CbiK
MVTDTVFSLESGTQEGFDLMPFLTAGSDANNNMIIDNDEEW